MDLISFGNKEIRSFISVNSPHEFNELFADLSKKYWEENVYPFLFDVCK